MAIDTNLILNVVVGVLLVYLVKSAILFAMGRFFGVGGVQSACKDTSEMTYSAWQGKSKQRV